MEWNRIRDILKDEDEQNGSEVVVEVVLLVVFVVFLEVNCMEWHLHVQSTGE